jgi:hypothetical protein
MGVEYWLVDKGTKTFYDLGKGPWGWSGDDFTFALSDVDTLKEALCGVWSESRRFNTVPMLPDDYEYVWWLAEDLNRCFGSSNEGDMTIVSDGGDELTIMRSKGYRGLGTRYLHRATDEDREKEMSRLNRHLDADGKITRHYDPEGLKSCPGWDDW